MKKVLALSLVLLMVLSCFAGCGTKNEKKDEKGPTTALDLMNAVWEKYDDEEKFPAAGGDFTEENMNMEGPGKFGLEDKESLAATFYLSDNAIGMIDDAASLMHMMLANNFTSVALHVKDSKNVQKLADDIKASLEDAQWICGTPEKMLIVQVGDYVVSAFGASDIIDTFKANLEEAYSYAKVIYNNPIA